MRANATGASGVVDGFVVVVDRIEAPRCLERLEVAVQRSCRTRAGAAHKVFDVLGVHRGLRGGRVPVLLPDLNDRIFSASAAPPRSYRSMLRGRPCPAVLE